MGKQKKDLKFLRFSKIRWRVEPDGTHVSDCHRVRVWLDKINGTEYWMGSVDCYGFSTHCYKDVFTFSVNNTGINAEDSGATAKRFAVRFFNGLIVEQMQSQR